MDYGDNLRRAVIFDSAGHLDDEKYLVFGTKNKKRTLSVSYTHLDVYKRQLHRLSSLV